MGNHVAKTREIKNAYVILIGNTEWKWGASEI